MQISSIKLSFGKQDLPQNPGLNGHPDARTDAVLKLGEVDEPEDVDAEEGDVPVREALVAHQLVVAGKPGRGAAYPCLGKSFIFDFTCHRYVHLAAVLPNLENKEEKNIQMKSQTDS